MKKSTDAKSFEYYMSLRYKIELIPDEDEGGYVALHPELRGCITCADDIPSALVMLEDAKREWLCAALNDDYPIPMPGDVSPTKVKVTFRVDKDIKERAERLFTSLGIDMNTAVTIFLRKAIEENGIPFRVSTNKRVHELILSDEPGTLNDLFKDYNGDFKPEEWNTGKPVGNEIW